MSIAIYEMTARIVDDNHDKAFPEAGDDGGWRFLLFLVMVQTSFCSDGAGTGMTYLENGFPPRRLQQVSQIGH